MACTRPVPTHVRWYTHFTGPLKKTRAHQSYRVSLISPRCHLYASPYFLVACKFRQLSYSVYFKLDSVLVGIIYKEDLHEILKSTSSKNDATKNSRYLAKTSADGKIYIFSKFSAPTIAFLAMSHYQFTTKFSPILIGLN